MKMCCVYRGALCSGFCFSSDHLGIVLWEGSLCDHTGVSSLLSRHLLSTSYVLHFEQLLKPLGQTLPAEGSAWLGCSESGGNTATTVRIKMSSVQPGVLGEPWGRWDSSQPWGLNVLGGWGMAGIPGKRAGLAKAPKRNRVAEGLELASPQHCRLSRLLLGSWGQWHEQKQEVLQRPWHGHGSDCRDGAQPNHTCSPISGHQLPDQP